MFLFIFPCHWLNEKNMVITKIEERKIVAVKLSFKIDWRMEMIL